MKDLGTLRARRQIVEKSIKPAAQFEAAVVEELRGYLRSPEMKQCVSAIATLKDPGLDEAKVHVAMLQIDAIWDQLFPPEQERVVRLLVSKVVVTPHNIDLQLRANGFEKLAAELKLARPAETGEVAA